MSFLTDKDLDQMLEAAEKGAGPNAPPKKWIPCVVCAGDGVKMGYSLRTKRSVRECWNCKGDGGRYITDDYAIKLRDETLKRARETIRLARIGLKMEQQQ